MDLLVNTNLSRSRDFFYFMAIFRVLHFILEFSTFAYLQITNDASYCVVYFRILVVS